MGLAMRMTWLVLVTFLIPAIARTQSTQPALDRAADDLAVYTALVNYPSLKRAGGKRAIIVTRELASPRDDRTAENLRQFLRRPATSTIEAFVTAVRRKGELPAAIGQQPDVTLIAGTELARVLGSPERDYWRTFERRYPDARGILSLSAIAYGESGTEAMAYLGFMCGGTCGHGLAVVLQRNGGDWVPVEHAYLWES